MANKPGDKKVRKGTILITISILIVFAGYKGVEHLLVGISKKEVVQDRESLEKTITNDTSLKEIQNVGKTIEEVHTLFNKMLGWNAVTEGIFESEEQEMNRALHHIRSLVKDQPDKEVTPDLLNAILVLEKSIKDKGIKGLYIVHRIMHDLDHFYNGKPLDDKVWNYTLYGKGSEAEIIKYLR